MPTQKRGKKSGGKDEMLQIITKEIEQIKEVAVKILKRMNKELDSNTFSEHEKLACDRIFGSKTSLAETLVILADLLLKLTPTQGASTIGQTSVAHASSINSSDIALIEAFVKRSREQSGPKQE